MSPPPRPDGPRRQRREALWVLRSGARRGDDGQISLLVLVLTIAVLAMIGLSVDGGGKVRALQRADNLAAEAARAVRRRLPRPHRTRRRPAAARRRERPRPPPARHRQHSPDHHTPGPPRRPTTRPCPRLAAPRGPTTAAGVGERSDVAPHQQRGHPARSHGIPV
jgi:hypothetical protein